MACQVQGAFRTDKDETTAVAVVDSCQECQSPSATAAHPIFWVVLCC